MNVNKRFLTIVSALPAILFTLLFSSCNKDEDDSKLYLDGEVALGSYDIFVNKLQKVTYHPYGVTHPDGNAMGMYYKLYDVMSKYDTVYRADVNPVPTERGKASFTAQYPDSLGTFSMYVTYYPIDSDEYYSSSSTFYVTTIDRDESIPEITADILKPHYFDTRDNELYNYVEAGGLYWMTSNLRYGGSDTEILGTAYYNCEAARPVFGSFYTWENAQKACPKGWRLPSNEDWVKLAKIAAPSKGFTASEDFVDVAGDFMIDAHFNGDKMWEFWPVVKITNKLGVSFIPCGYTNVKVGEGFKGMTEYACFWTSDANPLDEKLGLFRYIYEQENDVKIGTADKNSIGMSVRCVKDLK